MLHTQGGSQPAIQLSRRAGKEPGSQIGGQPACAHNVSKACCLLNVCKLNCKMVGVPKYLFIIKYSLALVTCVALAADNDRCCMKA